jgi:hypothetical protein
MIALGQLVQNLVSGAIDKVAGLSGDLWTAGGTLGSNVVSAIQTFISG